jgi:hypothetical protein
MVKPAFSFLPLVVSIHSMRRFMLWRAVLLLGLAACAAPLRETPSAVFHRTPGDTLGNRYRVHLSAGKPQGLLVMLPGYGSDVNGFSAASYTPSALPARMARQGVLTVVAVPNPATLYESEEPLRVLDSIIAEVVQQYGLTRDRVVVGGFSSGGTGAVRYAQYCARARCEAVERVAGVFAVDSPLDFERIYRGEDVSIRRGAPATNLAEAQMILSTLRRSLGGSPDEAAEAYRQHSPLLATAPDGGNARLLVGTPIRLYTEPDVQWWMENRNLDYHGMNSVDHAALINLLRIAGNARAELIVTTGKGYRPDGRRHPHSWSIVDEADLARWIADLIRAPR